MDGVLFPEVTKWNKPLNVLVKDRDIFFVLRARVLNGGPKFNNKSPIYSMYGYPEDISIQIAKRKRLMSIISQLGC